MYSPMTSLADPPTGSPIADGILWVQGAALGSTATTIAVLAVAAVGLLMLSGRLELRRGITTVLGCFILFGASDVVAALTDQAISQPAAPLSEPASTDLLANRLTSPPLPVAPYDPYAGASVPSVR